MRYKKYIIFLLFLMSCALYSQDDILFREALELYKAGDFEKAKDKFLELNELLNKKNLVSAEIFYNIGNCYFRQNKFGYARYYYELAKIYNWYDSDVNHNLNFIKKVTNNEQEGSFLENIVKIFSFSETFILLFVFNFLFFGSLIVNRFFSNSFINWLKRISFVLFVIFLMLAISKYSIERQRKGVVVEPTNLLSSPDEGSFSKFIPINEAKKVIILSEKENYYAVYLPKDKIQGWIKKQAVKLIIY